MLSLSVLALLVERLDGADELESWALRHHQVAPTVAIGHTPPATADGWPYIRLTPSTERRDLIEGTIDQLTVILALGARLAEGSETQTDAALGTAMIADLAETCLTLLTTPPGYTFGASDLVADYAELADVSLVHPAYECQLALSLRLLSDTAP